MSQRKKTGLRFVLWEAKAWRAVGVRGATRRSLARITVLATINLAYFSVLFGPRVVLYAILEGVAVAGKVLLWLLIIVIPATYMVLSAYIMWRQDAEAMRTDPPKPCNWDEGLDSKDEAKKRPTVEHRGQEMELQTKELNRIAQIKVDAKRRAAKNGKGIKLEIEK